MTKSRADRRRLWGWLVVLGLLLAATIVVLTVYGVFEDPRQTAAELRRIGERLMIKADSVVAEGSTFSVTTWMTQIGEVDSFHDRAGFAKDELRAAVRAVGRYAEVRDDRDMDLAHWHYGRFHRQLRALERGE
jgi:hypothetical protein